MVTQPQYKPNDPHKSTIEPQPAPPCSGCERGVGALPHPIRPEEWLCRACWIDVVRTTKKAKAA